MIFHSATQQPAIAPSIAPSITRQLFDFVAISSMLALTGCDGSSSESAATANSSTASGYKIVDTNQTDCYNSPTGLVTPCSGKGHDGDYAGNQPSYTVSSDGQTVTDNVTGLIWQQSSDLNSDDLSLAGRQDWRLPNIKEAYSLILFSGKDPSSYTGSDTSGLAPFIDSASTGLSVTPPPPMGLTPETGLSMPSMPPPHST